ncbi:filamin-C-like isoform X1 [Saccostrea cucullata]|uniref:filamin-C-like isoform X1 n=1 Tax=Saccostrea cuccullata TaxID=36930 RepID=UPI002ED2FD74
MEVETDSKEVIEISVDSVLGELQSVLKGKIPESDSSSESEEDVPTEKDPQSPQEEKEGHVCNNKTDEEKMVENSSVSPVSPKSFVDRPIIFKSSIKKDPGSKLHDQLVKELGSVLKKRNKENDLDAVKEEEKKVKDEKTNNNRRPGPLKLNNSVFANKALLAHLENHLKKSLHKTDVAGKPRTSMKDSSFNNDSSNLPNIMESSISGAAQFGVKLRHTQTRTSEGDGVEMNGELSPDSSHTSPQKSSQSEILLQARASLTSTPQPKVLSQNSLTAKTDKVVVPLENSRTAKTDNVVNPPQNSRTAITDKVVVPLQNRVVATTESRNIVSQSRKAISVVSKQTSQLGGSVYHVSSLKRDGKHLTQISIGGCPVIHTIDEGGLPSASGPGLYKGQEDKEAVFYVDVGKRSGDLDIKVEGPNSIAKTTVERAGEKFIVNYTPVEVGIFNIGILWNGTPIPGSPFHPKVFDPRKVRISGGWAQYMDGNERVGLVVGEEKRLVFDISQAGPGSLRAEVVGPGSTVPATVTDSYGQTLVAFVPREEGNHYIHLYWSDVALPNSPFLGYAVPAFSDANKVILTGRGLKEATVREEAEFVIDGSQAGPEYQQPNSK